MSKRATPPLFDWNHSASRVNDFPPARNAAQMQNAKSTTAAPATPDKRRYSLEKPGRRKAREFVKKVVNYAASDIGMTEID